MIFGKNLVHWPPGFGGQLRWKRYSMTRRLNYGSCRRYTRIELEDWCDDQSLAQRLYCGSILGGSCSQKRLRRASL